MAWICWLVKENKAGSGVHFKFGYGHAARYWARLGKVAGSGVGLLPLPSHEEFEAENRPRLERKSPFLAHLSGTRRDRHEEEHDLAPLPLSADRAYPRPRDRRFTRKTRAAVGKPPASTDAHRAVSNADDLDDHSFSIAPAALDHCICGQEYFGAASFQTTLAESARLMPDTASPLPASVGANAGLIS